MTVSTHCLRIFPMTKKRWASRQIPSVNSIRILPFFCAVFCVLSIFTGNCAAKSPGSTDDKKTDIRALYPDKSESMTRKECMQCHPDIARLLRDAGAGHTRVACRECHLQVHVYIPGKTRYEDILPKCSRCHQHPHGEELLDCSGCHQEAHAPLYIPAGSVLAQWCYVCHQELDKDIKIFVTQHTELYCTGCHHTKHGHVPGCLECHQSHEGTLPAEGGITADETPLGQCLTCHPPHKALKVVYPDDTPDTVCAYCHRKADEMLDKNKTKHTTLKCTQCHPKKHPAIKRCKECHGVPHPEAMIKNFNTCGQCHGVAHSVIR